TARKLSPGTQNAVSTPWIRNASTKTSPPVLAGTCLSTITVSLCSFSRRNEIIPIELRHVGHAEQGQIDIDFLAQQLQCARGAGLPTGRQAVQGRPTDEDEVRPQAQ